MKEKTEFPSSTLIWQGVIWGDERGGKGGCLLFYSTKEVGIDGPSVFLYFWLLFVERFFSPVGIFGLMVVGSMVG